MQAAKIKIACIWAWHSLKGDWLRQLIEACVKSGTSEMLVTSDLANARVVMLRQVVDVK